MIVLVLFSVVLIWCFTDLIRRSKSTSSTRPLQWILRTKFLEVVPRIAHVSLIYSTYPRLILTCFIGPVCRAAISPEKLFSREAFEYLDEDLKEEDEDNVMNVLSDSLAITSKRKNKGRITKKSKKAGRASRRKINESDDEGDAVSDNESDYDDDDDDDLSDFIVNSDEDEEEKDERKAMKTRQTKKHKNVILDSDDEPDTPEEREVIFGLKKKEPMTMDVVPIMSRFLPSTKMKVRPFYILSQC